MKQDQEKHEALRKLIALKRLELPPPEYLHQLSDSIITRIERGEGRLNLWDRLSANFALRPSLVYAFGLTVCGALGLSAVYLIRQEVMQTADAASGAVLRSPNPSVAFASQMNPVMPPLHVANWLGDPGGGLPTAPELAAWRGSPYLCLYGEEDGDSACAQATGRDGTVVKMAGGHHFGGSYGEIADEILKRLPKP